MEAIPCPRTRAEFVEKLTDFESEYGRKPVVHASDELLLCMDDWSKARYYNLPAGTTLVAHRRLKYDKAIYLGCRIVAGGTDECCLE